MQIIFKNFKKILFDCTILLILYIFLFVCFMNCYLNTRGPYVNVCLLLLCCMLIIDLSKLPKESECEFYTQFFLESWTRTLELLYWSSHVKYKYFFQLCLLTFRQFVCSSFAVNEMSVSYFEIVKKESC